ncbi:unnamed protein product, partial [Hapterophycus canaliculatus]
QFKILQNKGIDSVCWREAAVSINADCTTITTTRKQRLAVQLSNCHLQSSGRKGTRCNPEDSDEQCVKATRHDNSVFNSYSQFFHHVNGICHHLSQSIWQEQTQDLIQGLTVSSLATFDRAEKSLEKQKLVLEGQERASTQSQGIADGLSETKERLAGFSDHLSQELVSAIGQIEKQENVLASLMATQALAANQASSFSAELGSAKSELTAYMEAIEEDRRESKKQNVDLMETIGFIHSCLDNASSAWAKFQAFTYLILAVNLCWVLTTAPPLRSARTALFGLVAFGLLLEKSLCGDDDSREERPLPVDWVVSGLRMASPGTFSADTWDMVVTQEKIRWLTFQAGAVVLGHALASYFLPFLEVWRVVGFFMAAWRGSNNASGGQRAPRSRAGRIGGCGGGNNQSGSGGVLPLRLRFDGASGGRGSGGSGGGGDGGRSGSGGGGIRPRRGSNSSDGSTAESADVGRPGGRVHDPLRRGQPASGSDSEEEGGGEAEGDGLDMLKRKELQSLAKSTDGVVKANQSSPEIVKGLRALGITADAHGS